MMIQIGGLTVLIGCLPHLPILLILLILSGITTIIACILGLRAQRRAAMLERAYVGLARRG